MSSASLVLPFVVPSADLGRKVSPAMEFAALLFWAEERRKQRGFLDSTEKRLMSLSKLHYPLWAVPWENASLIVDGLDLLSSTIAFQTLPSVTEFIDDVERGMPVRAQFHTALSKHEKAFAELAKIEQIQINGLVSNDELLSALHDYIKETAPLKLAGKDQVPLVPPKLDREAAVQRAKRIPQLQNQIFSEIRSLEYAASLLVQTARAHEEMIQKEADLARESYEAEINRLRPSVDKKLDQLLKELDARIFKMNRLMNRELGRREKERQRHERELQRLELGKADSLRRRDMRKQKHDSPGAAHWEHKIKIDEAKTEDVEARIHSLSEFIEKTQTQNQADIEKLRQGYQWLIDQEKRKILDLELQRDSIVAAKQKEIDRIRNLTDSIKSEIEELIERKREQETRLKRLGMAWPLDEATLISIPFYLACYHAQDKTKFQVLSPSIVTRGAGIVRTLQKTLRSLRPASGTALPLQPRSKALGEMLDSVIVGKMESDEAFLNTLHEAVNSGNILARPDFKDVFSKGVEELRAERWISQKEVDALIQAYT